MPTIIPIRDLRDTNRMSEICKGSQEPIFITKNGYGDMVIMSMEVYERQMRQIQVHQQILAGKAQADAGELTDGATVMNGLREKYGL